MLISFGHQICQVAANLSSDPSRCVTPLTFYSSLRKDMTRGVGVSGARASPQPLNKAQAVPQAAGFPAGYLFSLGIDHPGKPPGWFSLDTTGEARLEFPVLMSKGVLILSYLKTHTNAGIARLTVRPNLMTPKVNLN